MLAVLPDDFQILVEAPVQICFLESGVLLQNVLNKIIHLLIVKGKIPEEVPRNGKKVEDVHGFRSGRHRLTGYFQYAVYRLAVLRVRRLLHQVRRRVADFPEFTVCQLEKGREDIDSALQVDRNRFLVLDLVVQPAPRVLNQ